MGTIRDISRIPHNEARTVTLYACKWRHHSMSETETWPDRATGQQIEMHVEV